MQINLFFYDILKYLLFNLLQFDFNDSDKIVHLCECKRLNTEYTVKYLYFV